MKLTGRVVCGNKTSPEASECNGDESMKILPRNHGVRAGFSLAELMVVIVIIGLLVGLVVPNLWRNFIQSQETIARAEITNIMSALQNYAMNNSGQYPDSLEPLVTPDEKGEAYLDTDGIPLDPWSNEYQYEPPGPGQSKPVVYSFGKDGSRGGEGEDADILSTDLKRR